MAIFRIRYNLLDGTLVGYHADSFCAITSNPEHAKLYKGPAERANELLERVRKNFKFGWDEPEENLGFSQEYRSHPCWKGCDHDQIRLSVEEVT